ncbi:Deoxyribodipyrimidine photolyase, type II (EC [Olavius algarvensis Delta 1 endosymbiont]|nr:Deoxyribodipyrimidine photolyase, type II (EC [Olavius algarvensis Delta 1 endosymbiont]
MNFQTVQKSRIQVLNDAEIAKGRYVLYWMQQSQRADYNHALEYAIQQANRLGQGVLVAFGMMDDYPEANLRHYTFMLQGLKETRDTLARRGIKMVIQQGKPADVALKIGRNASVIVCDCGYLRHQKAWRDDVAQQAGCRVVQVESDVIIPLQVVSNKAEYAARTIRPKINRHLAAYLIDFEATSVKKSSLKLDVKGLEIDNIEAVLEKMKLDHGVRPVTGFFKGGASRARQVFKSFLHRRLDNYVANRNQPQTDDISHMSPYLHFGQISPLYLALQINHVDSRLQAAKDSFLEELIVRRELAMNFANYAPHYDSYKCLPNWARLTLAEHRQDPREYVYTRRQLEDAQTHDEYWNAAMQEMRYTGFMHNYMRMYWGKKILEWSKTPEHAYRTTLAINNKYFLDGRDPNSYTGVAWVYGVHDRAWFERPIFGKIRYMAASGLERKCDIKGYVRKVDDLVYKA